MKHQIQSVQIVVPCQNFDETLEFFTETLGFRLEMIFPADAPCVAVISGYGVCLRLEEADETRPLKLNLEGDFSSVEREIVAPEGIELNLIDANDALEIPVGTDEFVLTTLKNENSWHVGRAGMAYRDLIPNRLGGRFIASHIRIESGGEVPDYVHFHKIRFQMIYCLAGWAKLVYENQGEPFVMRVGDCVLQPPEIRHRVLECSDAFEVLEIGCPAVHETFAEHEIELPNDVFAPEMLFGGQKFVHHNAEKAVWKQSEDENLETRNCGIAEATENLADVRVFRAVKDAKFAVKHHGEFLFFYVSSGNLQISDEQGENHKLEKGSSVVLPSDKEFLIDLSENCELIRVDLGI